MKNIGVGTESVSLIGFVSTDNEFVTVEHNGLGHYKWLNIDPGESTTNLDGGEAEVTVSSDTPNGTSITFTLNLLESTGHTQDPDTTPAWTGSFSLTIE